MDSSFGVFFLIPLPTCFFASNPSWLFLNLSLFFQFQSQLVFPLPISTGTLQTRPSPCSSGSNPNRSSSNSAFAISVSNSAFTISPSQRLTSLMYSHLRCSASCTYAGFAGRIHPAVERNKCCLSTGCTNCWDISTML